MYYIIYLQEIDLILKNSLIYFRIHILVYIIGTFKSLYYDYNIYMEIYLYS